MATLPLRIECRADSEPWVIEQRMFDTLNDFLQPSSQMTSAQAAQGLNDCFPLHRADDDGIVEQDGEESKGEEPESFLWEMWDLVVRVAQQVPYKHPSQDKLAELVKALRDLNSGTRVDIWGIERKLWEDLPLLHQQILETGNTFNLQELHTNEEKRERWQSFIAFIARLTSDKTQPEPIFAIWALRYALEEEPDSRARAYHTQGPTLDAQMPAAVEWILVSGRVLYESCQSSDKDERADYDATKGGRNFKGQGLSLERWKFWKQRFAQIQLFDQVREATKVLAKEAVEEMEAIEREANVQKV
ncbi:hypothetical protein HYDPIDRAFT_33424 [Hydnomerulius pinastri MD-312]|uniref:Uncharacterized protein n=1 Tax=Hydnomerulius pinastri MD-312 TaxID=994086 RepID=A0A0C9W8Y2_9AGAM|nr:hypothetical protein HYDPIDRAFT_33424 [Hydnomerulius pinastri MD-312]